MLVVYQLRVLIGKVYGLGGKRGDGVSSLGGAFEWVRRVGKVGGIWKEVLMSKEVWVSKARSMWDHILGEMW